MKKEERDKVKPLSKNLPWALDPGCEIHATLCKRWASSDCKHWGAAENLQTPSYGFPQKVAGLQLGQGKGSASSSGEKQARVAA